MLVQVEFSKDSERRYTYDAGDLQLEVGDTVEVPGGKKVRVMELGSSYDGPTKRLVRKCVRKFDVRVTLKGAAAAVEAPAAGNPLEFRDMRECLRTLADSLVDGDLVRTVGVRIEEVYI